MAILEQRGLFWWHDEAVPEKQFAPDSCVSGLCRVRDDGGVDLELDSFLPSEHGPMASIARQPVAKCIQGILKGTGERILLADVIHNGGSFSSNAMSYERYVATHCLVGRTPFPPSPEPPRFDLLEIPLTGFEEWLRFGSTKVSRANGDISATYTPPEDLAYPFSDGTLSLVFDVDADSSGMLRTHAFSLKQTAAASLRFHQPRTLTELGIQYGLFEDLRKLLTGSNYGLDWPSLGPHDGERYRWYFLRVKGPQVKAPEHYNTITNFLELRDQFGALWST